MKRFLYLLILCHPLSGCFKDDENLNLKSNLFDKDYEGNDPFTVINPEYYFFTTVQSGQVIYHYRVKFYIVVDASGLPKNTNEAINCTNIDQLTFDGHTASGNKRYHAIKIVGQGGGTYCFDISFKDKLGYLGHKFNHCITATG